MELPNASSSSLVLAQPTQEEQVRTWTHNHPWWGPSYTLEAYLDRERRLLDVPLARNGGITQWILTDGGGGSGAEPRPVLASCETLRKRALVRHPGDAFVRDVWAHGVASVFTYPEFRRRGYANRLMEMLAARLAEQDAAFSVLFSDIGKAFYGRLGWTPYESTHLAFPVPAAAASPSPAARPILDADVEALARRDEELLRTRLCAPAHDPAKTRVAVVPDLDTLQWHFAREALMSTHLFSETPTVRGAVYTPADAPRGARVWAYWVRNQAGGTHDTSKNVVEFLRLVVEDEAVSDAVLGDAIAAIASLAQAEARQWRCTTMKLWNPGERVERLVASMSHLNAQLVVRESDSITSLRWLGSEHVAGIDWVANEKFEWC